SVTGDAVPPPVAQSTVTVLVGEPETETVKTNAVVPESPSFLLTSPIVILHSKRRSCRWFLSPQPFPGFVVVGVVVVVVDVVVVVEVVIVVEYSYASATLLRLVTPTPAASPSATSTARAKLTASSTRTRFASSLFIRSVVVLDRPDGQGVTEVGVRAGVRDLDVERLVRLLELVADHRDVDRRRARTGREGDGAALREVVARGDGRHVRGRVAHGDGAQRGCRERDREREGGRRPDLPLLLR